MKAYYKRTSDLDLTLDEFDLESDVEIPEVPEDNQPTASMRDHFYQNCVKSGILTIIYK